MTTSRRTPENTPLPGGGRWAWDTERAEWIGLDQTPHTAPDAPADQPTDAAGAGHQE